MHEYKTARSVCGFVEFCAWAGVVVAILIALMAIAAGSSRGGGVALVALVPAFSLALASFIVIVMVQMARASMDNSVTAQKQLMQSNTQHQEMLTAIRSLSGRASGVSSSDTLGTVAPDGNPVTATSAEANSVEMYKGHKLVTENGQHRVHGRPFPSLEKARAHIDSIAVNDAPTTPRELTVTRPPGLG